MSNWSTQHSKKRNYEKHEPKGSRDPLSHFIWTKSHYDLFENCVQCNLTTMGTRKLETSLNYGINGNIWHSVCLPEFDWIFIILTWYCGKLWNKNWPWEYLQFPLVCTHIFSIEWNYVIENTLTHQQLIRNSMENEWNNVDVQICPMVYDIRFCKQIPIF